MHDGVRRQALHIDKDVALPALDLLAIIVTNADQSQAPSFRALDARLWIITAVSTRIRLAALRIKRDVDAIELAVPARGAKYSYPVGRGDRSLAITHPDAGARGYIRPLTTAHEGRRHPDCLRSI